MKTYFDRFKFLHDKPCINGKASSGNPLIYSALYKCLTGAENNFMPVFQSQMIKHSVMSQDITIIRHPDKPYPTSLDEVIAAIYLGLIDADFLKIYNWRWHDTLFTPKWWRVLKAAIYCLGEHRNFFKDQNVRDLHPVAYNVAPHIRYYALRKSGKFHIIYYMFFILWAFSVLIKTNYKNCEKQTGNISQKNILWLIASDLNCKLLLRFLNYKKNLRDYFEFKDHPIIKALKSVY